MERDTIHVELIFPPQYSPTSPPYLSNPSLTAFLRDNNYDVTQKDVNIEIYNSILSRSYITKVIDKLHNEFVPTRQKIEREYFIELLKVDEYILENIDEWKRVLKSDNIGDISKRLSATRGLDTALEIISLPFFPNKISLGYDQTRFVHDKKGNAKDLLMGIEDEKTNMYHSFFKEYLKKNEIRGDIIGISVPILSQLLPAFTLASMIKPCNPNTCIIIGGPLNPYILDLFENYKYSKHLSFIDGICIGEGETPLLKICENLESGNEFFNNVPNLIYHHEGKFLKTQLKSYEDVNKLPCPTYDNINFDKYLNAGKLLPILSSRGCHWNKCTYCSLCSSYSNIYRERDVEKFIDDIRCYISRYNVDAIYLCDECVHAARLGKISENILSEGLQINWFALSRFEDNLTGEILKKARKAGCVGLSFGLESASKRVLNRMNKGIDVYEAERILKRLHELDIWTNVFTIIGYPTETREEAMETVNFLLKNASFIDCSQTAKCRLEVGSTLYKHKEKLGIKIRENRDYYNYYERSKYEVNEGMTIDEINSVDEYLHNKLSDHPNYDAYYEGLTDDYLNYMCGKYGKSVITEYTTNNLNIMKRLKKDLAKINHIEKVSIRLKTEDVSIIGRNLLNIKNGRRILLNNDVSLWLINIMKEMNNLHEIIWMAYDVYGYNLNIKSDILSFYSLLISFGFIEIY